MCYLPTYNCTELQKGFLERVSFLLLTITFSQDTEYKSSNTNVNLSTTNINILQQTCNNSSEN